MFTGAQSVSDSQYAGLHIGGQPRFGMSSFSYWRNIYPGNFFGGEVEDIGCIDFISHKRGTHADSDACGVVGAKTDNGLEESLLTSSDVPEETGDPKKRMSFLPSCSATLEKVDQGETVELSALTVEGASSIWTEPVSFWFKAT